LSESLVDRKVPPVTEIGAVSLAAVVVGVIYNASYLPKHAQTGVAVAILAVAVALLLVNVFLLTRIHEFAWARFRQVAGWALLAYVIIGGMIEYAFVYDHTRGTQLVILTCMLALFVLNVPVLIAFTVARYQRA
jgi:hypothetical protein